jgi:threonine/homoserine/homoserine lactone efflux protein
MTFEFNIAIFMLSVAVVLLTPGPTNTLLAAAGFERGIGGALPLIASELAGYVIAISIWGVLLLQVQHQYPWSIAIVRIASSFYLVFIAVKLWGSARAVPAPGRRSIGSKALFGATLLNPKALLFSSTIFPPHAFDSVRTYLTLLAIFSCLLVPIGFGWTWIGAKMGSGNPTAMRRVNFQRAAALVVGIFSASIALAAFH